MKMGLTVYLEDSLLGGQSHKQGHVVNIGLNKIYYIIDLIVVWLCVCIVCGY